MRILKRDDDIFGFTDKCVAVYRKRIMRIFNKLKRSIVGMDEMNVLAQVNQCFVEIIAETVACLKKIAKRKYNWICEDEFDEDMWLGEYLEQFNKVTGYKFYPEADRKRARTFESILSVKTTGDKNKAIDKALRLWILQLKQYADNVTIEVIAQAYEDSGVEKIMLITQRDEKVCSECHPIDGKIVALKDNPLPLHYNCRCYFIPVINQT